MAVYSVSQVTSYLRALLERDAVARDLWVGGEVASLSRSATGHSYFSLRETDSTLRCVMFRNSLGAERLAGGAAVIAHGRISLYEARGDLQFIVDMVQAEGVGELQLKLDQLKLKLQREGLFEPSRKRDLPAYPRKIAVVTSPTGAVWQDIQTVIARRYPLVELLLAPTPVQGDTASSGIVEAFKALNDLTDVDAVILARGGGSLEDLWSFNEEAVARAIYASRSPVVSAIGHESDFTIADMVADKRAPTPSAAAEMVTPDRLELSTKLLVARRALIARVTGNHSDKANDVEMSVQRLQRGLPNLDSMRIRIDDLLGYAGTHLKHSSDIKAERLDGLRLRLEALSPTDTLRRGYAVVERREDHAIVTDADHVDPGDGVRVMLSRGSIDADVVSATSADRLREVKAGHSDE
jgi:exodeoxyribonuclease VII large subunit